MGFSSALKRIKDLKVQGATNIALYGLDAFLDYSKTINTENKKVFFKKLDKALIKIITTRKTEPMLQNALRGAVNSVYELDDVSKIKARLKEYAWEYPRKIKQDMEKIAEYGSSFIENDSIIFTHCHSSSVVSVLSAARQLGKHFEVVNTETRPRYQGRKTSKQLVNIGIKTTHIIDSNCVDYIKKSDLVLLGADAFTPSSFINKVGSLMICTLAKQFEVPVHVCTLSSKYFYQSSKGTYPSIEERDKREVWNGAPKGLIIRNPAFEEVSADYVSLVISEFGSLGFSQTLERILSLQ